MVCENFEELESCELDVFRFQCFLVLFPFGLMCALWDLLHKEELLLAQVNFQAIGLQKIGEQLGTVQQEVNSNLIKADTIANGSTKYLRLLYAGHENLFEFVHLMSTLCIEIRSEARQCVDDHVFFGTQFLDCNLQIHIILMVDVIVLLRLVPRLGYFLLLL